MPYLFSLNYLKTLLGILLMSEAQLSYLGNEGPKNTMA